MKSRRKIRKAGKQETFGELGKQKNRKHLELGKQEDQA